MHAPTVLLIDQDTDSLVIYSLFLEYNGFRVLRSESGEEGFRLACENRPDVIVAELFLPMVADRHLAELLKDDERTAGIPLVAVTTLPPTSIGADVRLRRCDGYLTKPCIPSRILEEVSRFLPPRALLS